MVNQQIAISVATHYISAFARWRILQVLSKIESGVLCIKDASGTYSFGNTQHENQVTLTVKNEWFWFRLALFADLGLCEAYMADECEISDLTTFWKILIKNRKHLTETPGLFSNLMNRFQRATKSKLVNSIANAVLNTQAHYDLGNEMFQLFLDSSMTYSCPLWESPNDTLYDAQMHKIRQIILKAQVQPEHHVLEIGTGWGLLAIELVKSTKCQLTTITLSMEQKIYATKLVEKEGLQDRIKVLLCDYRSLTTKEPFDRIISIEMIEAVGQEYLSTYFAQCSNLLKQDGGIIVLQGTTIHELHYKNYCRGKDFIQKHIFLGGHAPSITALVNACNEGSNSTLTVNELTNIGPHYVKTLKIWGSNWLKNFHNIHALDPIRYSHEFRRKWEMYFAYCEAGFAEHCLGVVQMVLTRPNNALFSGSCYL